MAMVIGGLSAGASLVGGLSGMFGSGGANSIPSPQMYQFGNMGGADQNAYGGIGQLGQYNAAGSVLPQYGNISQGLVNNPYAGFMQGGAGGAAGLGMGAAGNQYNLGGQLEGIGSQQIPGYAQAVMNTAFDPQQQLYQKYAQQTQDQANAQNAQSGVATSPWGAGVANQAMQNFNLGWQQQQLGNQVSGLNAASGALGQGANIANTGASLQAGASPAWMQAATLPYSTYNTIGQGQLGALGQYGQFGALASQNPQQQIQDYMGYLGAGNQANQIANQNFGLQLQQQNQQFNQNQQFGRQIGAGLSGLGNMMGGTGGGWGNSWIGQQFGGAGSGGSGNPFNQTTGAPY